MRMLDLGSLSAVAAGSTITTKGTGFLPGETVVAHIVSPGGAFAGSAQIQTSVDGTSWTNVGSAVTGGTDVQSITLSNFVRLNCTARSAGTVKAVLTNAIA
jgi:hypothetical protein